MMNKIVSFLIWCLVLAMVSISLGFTIYERKKIVCTDIRVEIIDSTDNQFINGRDMRNWLISHYPHILRQNLERIDLRNIEDGLRKIKAIEDVTVFTSIVG